MTQLELCTYHGTICASPATTTSRRSPTARFPGDIRAQITCMLQLDVILRSYLRKVSNTHRFLLCRNFRPQLKRFHRTKKQGYTRINVSNTFQPDLLRQFAVTIEKELGDSQPSWRLGIEKLKTLRDTPIHCTVLATFGKKISKTDD